jgi:phosphohistidine phosphatase
MKELILVRHAHAYPITSGQNDFDRGITPSGLAMARDLSDFMKESIPCVDAVFASPSQRTIQTASMLCSRLGFSHSNIRWDKRIYNASENDLLKVINGASNESNRLLIVGHNPGLSSLIYFLTGTICNLDTSSMAHLQLFVEEWAHVSKSTGLVLKTYFPGE